MIWTVNHVKMLISHPPKKFLHSPTSEHPCSFLFAQQLNTRSNITMTKGHANKWDTASTQTKANIQECKKRWLSYLFCETLWAFFHTLVSNSARTLLPSHSLRLAWWKKPVPLPRATYLFIPACVPAEWTFSRAADVVKAQCCLLLADHLDQVIFLKKNLEIEYVYGKLLKCWELWLQQPKSVINIFYIHTDTDTHTHAHYLIS